MLSVPIITEVVSSNPTHGEVFLIQHYVIKFVCDLWQVIDFPWVPRFPPHTKNGRLDRTEILLKVALNTINHYIMVYIKKSANYFQHV